jgi:hypothetical protein
MLHFGVVLELGLEVVACGGLKESFFNESPPHLQHLFYVPYLIEYGVDLKP